MGFFPSVALSPVQESFGRLHYLVGAGRSSKELHPTDQARLRTSPFAASRVFLRVDAELAHGTTNRLRIGPGDFLAVGRGSAIGESDFVC